MPHELPNKLRLRILGKSFPVLSPAPELKIL